VVNSLPHSNAQEEESLFFSHKQNLVHSQKGLIKGFEIILFAIYQFSGFADR